jgi:hypothetical protein
MGGPTQGLEGAVAVTVAPPLSFVLVAGAHPILGINPPSIYLSDTGAQAPPAIG